MTVVEIPSFEFSGIYYPQILEALIRFKRRYLPEHTNESPQDPLMQALRAFACVGHLNNALTDLVANESTLTTARLVDTVRNMFRLIGYRLAPAAPAQVSLLVQLSGPQSSAVELLPERAQFASPADAKSVSRYYEVLDAVTIAPTDEITAVRSTEDGVFTDQTTDANAGTPFTPWVTPVGGSSSREGDTLLLGHTDVVFDRLGVTLPVTNPDSAAYVATTHLEFDLTGYLGGSDRSGTILRVRLISSGAFEDVAVTYVAGVNMLVTTGKLGQTGTPTTTAANYSVAVVFAGVWEYYDGNYDKEAPSSVSDLGATLQLNLAGYLGVDDRRGTPIRVKLNETGAYEDLFSDFVGGQNIVTTATLLGQVSPSTDVNDYTIGSPWERMEADLEDGTDTLTKSGDVVFSVPEDQDRTWPVGEFDSATVHWFRFRIITWPTTTPPVPEIGLLTIDTGQQYYLANAIQGQTQSDSPLASSTGGAAQKYQGTQEHFIDGSAEVFVDGIQWTQVESFLSSRATDRHFVVELTTNDRPVITFGDGAAGAIPPTGVGNIRARYRYGANEDGNVGVGAVSQDRSGLSFVSTTYNPRAATGWEEAQGNTAASLERAKLEGPASLRVKDVATSPDDMADLAIRARTYDGTILSITRASPIEEGFGPKTVEVVVVSAGGGQATAAQLAALSVFLNGDQYAAPPARKRIVANQQAVPTNFIPRVINVTMAVTGKVTEAQCVAAVQRILQPEAKQPDGVAYVWDMGGHVAMSRIGAEIFKLDQSVSDVDVVETDIDMQRRELPVAGTIVISVTP